MMTDWFQVISMVVATPLVLFWVFLYLKYHHTFDAYIANLSSDDYKMPELFFIGMGFMNQVHYNLHTKRGLHRIKEISEVKGRKYAEYYYYIDRGAVFTYILTFVPLTVVLAALADNAQMLLIGVCVVVLLIRYLENEINDRLEARREELLMDLPQVLSKMALLVNSGMVNVLMYGKHGNLCFYIKVLKTKEETRMLKKLDQWLGMKKIAVQNALNSLIYEEKGATGMIEIIVLIVIIIAIAGIFRTQLSNMVSLVFSKLTEFING